MRLGAEEKKLSRLTDLGIGVVLLFTAQVNIFNTLTADYVYIRSLGYFYPFLFNRLYLEKEKR